MIPAEERPAAGPHAKQAWLRRPAWGRLLLMVGVALATLALLGYSVVRHWDTLTTYPWRVTLWPLGMALLLYPPSLGLAVVIWGGILQRAGGQRDWRRDLRIYCTSNLARRLPTVAWFVAGRLYLYGEAGIPKAVTSLATLVEGVLILFSGLIVLVVFLPFTSDMAWVAGHVPEVATVMLGSLFLILRPQWLTRCVDWLARRLGRGQTLAHTISYREMLLWTLYYALVWIMGGVIFYLLIYSLHPLPLASLPAVIGSWVAGGVISHITVLTPGGLGIRELSMAVLLAHLLPLPIALLIALVARVWFSLNELLWLALTARLP